MIRLNRFLHRIYKRINSGERTIRKEMIFALLLVAVIPASAFNAYFTKQVYNFTYENVDNYNKEIMRQMTARLDEILHGVKLARELSLEATVTLDFFEDYHSRTNLEKIEINKNVDECFRYIRRSFPYITDVYLISASGDIFASMVDSGKERLKNKDWIKNFPKRPGEEIILGPHIADYYVARGPSRKVYSFVLSIRSSDGTANGGILQIDVNYDVFKDIIENNISGDDSHFVLCDSNNNIIYISENSYELINYDNKKFFINDSSNSLNSRFLIKQQEISHKDWVLVGLFSKQSTDYRNRTVVMSFLFTMIALLIISILLSYFLSARIIKPLTNIIVLMKRVEEGNFDVEVSYSDHTEINALVKSFKKMISEIKSLLDINIRKEKEKTEAQMLAFQAQINPHYLYNTLETIKIMAYNSRAHDVVDVIKALAASFRYSINIETVIVRLEQELFHVSNYIKIQKYRFKDRINFKHNIYGEMCNYGVLRFMLQPLVENSIQHGIEYKSSKSIINIRVSIKNKMLVIKIFDNGVGIKKDVLNEINNQLSLPHVNTSPIEVNGSYKGIGLFNVNNRIKLYYGSVYGISIKSWVGIGTVVIINIPLLE